MNTKIIKLEETDSTNTYLKNYSPSDDEEMVVAVADYQTAGRGQGTHAWESERGKNLLFSILVFIIIICKYKFQKSLSSASNREAPCQKGADCTATAIRPVMD